MNFTGAYQGIDGAHSKLVLDAFFDRKGHGITATGVPTFRQTAIAVVNGKADVGIVPIDNAIAGTVREGYDILAEYELAPVAEVVWRMEHRLLGIPGASVDDVREVLGHPLILNECGRYLATLAAARVIPVEDTGVAAREVAAQQDRSIAAIAPPQAATLYGLSVLAENIADHPDNFTRFLIFAAPNAREVVAKLANTPPEYRKSSLLLSVSHEAGRLARVLEVFASAGINVSKLESKPKLGKAFEYVFYIDFEGDVHEPRVAQALAKLRDETVFMHVIGSYDTEGAPTQTKVAAPVRAPATVVSFDPSLLPASAKQWPKAARSERPAGTRVQIGNVVVGDGNFVVVAGPCSVESRDQIIETAKTVKALGAVMLRGGAFKPRTNPYSFQGLGFEGVALLAEAGRAAGLPIVSEVMSVDQVEQMAREVDVLQIGARNMQNFDLLKAVGKTDRPILLKRGMAASLDEFLAAAEYILAEGNPNVMLCERGIRTFETATRNTLDLSAVPVLRERSHLPVMVDPSHGVGVRRWILPLCRAAKAVGAHGLLVEVHPHPEEALSDKEQQLPFADFAAMMEDLATIPLLQTAALSSAE